MSADLLRRAAAKMRELAEAATPGPWARDVARVRASALDSRRVSSSMRPGMVIPPVIVSPPGKSVLSFDEQDANAEHIASWHPAVAFTVADWLDFSAWQIETFRDNQSPFAADHIKRAEHLACAYLGEPS